MSATAVIDFLLAGFTDNSGNPLASGKVYTYAAGSLTPKDTYTDNAGSLEQNPIILDSNGRKQVYAQGAYKLIIKTSAGATLYTYDNIFIGNTQNFSGVEATNLGNGTARSSAATVGQVQDGAVIYGGTSTGSANIFAITLSPAITTLVAGMRFSFKAHQANTAAATFNPNNLGATDIKRQASTVSICPGDINIDEIVTLEYDGTYWRLMSSRVEAFVSISAAGTDQGSATSITGKRVRISSGTLHQGVILPQTGIGEEYTIFNNTSVPICVYPAVGSSFPGFSANQFITLTAGAMLKVQAVTATVLLYWITHGVFAQNISAAGTTQGAGTQIAYPDNSVSVVTGAAAAVTLPHPYPGMRLWIINRDAADTLSIFPAVGDIISSHGTNAAITAGPGTGYVLIGVTNVAWEAQAIAGG